MDTEDEKIRTAAAVTIMGLTHQGLHGLWDAPLAPERVGGWRIYRRGRVEFCAGWRAAHGALRGPRAAIDCAAVTAAVAADAEQAAAFDEASARAALAAGGERMAQALEGRCSAFVRGGAACLRAFQARMAEEQAAA